MKRLLLLVAKGRYILIAIALIINSLALITGIKNHASFLFLMLPVLAMFITVLFPVANYILNRIKP
jgi:hypothetical protein